MTENINEPVEKKEEIVEENVEEKKDEIKNNMTYKKIEGEYIGNGVFQFTIPSDCVISRNVLISGFPCSIPMSEMHINGRPEYKYENDSKQIIKDVELVEENDIKNGKKLCDCGKFYSTTNISKHRKSKLHLKNMCKKLLTEAKALPKI